MNINNGETIYFACTYTAMWSETVHLSGGDTWTTCLFGLNSHSGCAVVVPRYEYNNLIYSVNLQHLNLDI